MKSISCNPQDTKKSENTVSKFKNSSMFSNRLYKAKERIAELENRP